MKTPLVAVDVIIEKNDKLLLVTRKGKPYADKLALPGGRVEINETVEEAARREVMEETGLSVDIVDMLGIYSNPKRDPRGHIISIVFIARTKTISVKAGSDASAAQWFDTDSIKKEYLAFDHFKILQDYIKWKDNRGTYWSGKHG